MGTLASELGPVADRVSAAPRIYADANIPAGLVSFMRTRLHWDVLFVIEHDDLRRAADLEHFRLARQLRRTLVTLDRDYLDDRRFPLAVCAGVLVVSAPDERLLAKLLSRLDRAIFRPRRGSPRLGHAGEPLPLEGRKLHVHPDWSADRAEL
ncbi:MAG: DUF5615 family PIN-like protein [Bacteroidales bacterium]